MKITEIFTSAYKDARGSQESARELLKNPNDLSGETEYEAVHHEASLLYLVSETIRRVLAQVGDIYQTNNAIFDEEHNDSMDANMPFMLITLLSEWPTQKTISKTVGDLLAKTNNPE